MDRGGVMQGESLPVGRVIVLDTETTGLNPADGHRVVEIGCVELLNLMPTGREFHVYCNPERDVPLEVERVHGLSTAFLAAYPTFAAHVEDLLAFLDGAEVLVAHNAEFDMRFLNAELALLRRPPLPHAVTDTAAIARRKFPGAPASLDALCRRFEIDRSERTKHGALIDSRLLARVYLELMGGQQPGLVLVDGANKDAAASGGPAIRIAREARPHAPSEAELAAHAAMVATLKNPLWLELQASDVVPSAVSSAP